MKFQYCQMRQFSYLHLIEFSHVTIENSFFFSISALHLHIIVSVNINMVTYNINQSLKEQRSKYSNLSSNSINFAEPALVNDNVIRFCCSGMKFGIMIFVLPASYGIDPFIIRIYVDSCCQYIGESCSSRVVVSPQPRTCYDYHWWKSSSLEKCIVERFSKIILETNSNIVSAIKIIEIQNSYVEVL